MSDQCKHCTVRGDINACLSTECFHHENWYAVKQQERIDELQQANNEAQSLIGLLESEVGKLKQGLEDLKRSDADNYGLYMELLFHPNEPPENLEAHNLTQQAKGITDAVKATVSNKYRLPLRDACELLDYAEQLRQQANKPASKRYFTYSD